MCHFYTASKIGITENRFSLRYLRDLTRLHDENEEKCDASDTDSVRSADDNVYNQKKNIIDLLTTKNDYDGEWNEDDCIYNLMRTTQESIERIIQSKKLSGKDWLKLVGNHMTTEYIALFDHINIDSLSLGEIESFKEITADFWDDNEESDEDQSILKSIKSTGAKMWKKMTTPRKSAQRKSSL